MNCDCAWCAFERPISHRITEFVTNVAGWKNRESREIVALAEAEIDGILGVDRKDDALLRGYLRAHVLRDVYANEREAAWKQNAKGILKRTSEPLS